MHGRIHAVTVVVRAEVKNLIVLAQHFALFFGDLPVESLSVLFYRVFCVFINRDFDYSIVFHFLLRNMKVFEVGMTKRLFYCDSVFGIKNQHFFNQI